MRTFRRLLQFLAPYKGGTALSTLLACMAMLGTIAIPYLSGQAVDAIQAADQDQLQLYAIAILVAAIARLALTVGRRLIAGRVSLGVEYDLRNRMYEHLSTLELAFYDHQQTGQLMSRVTVDLQAVRFFLGYGLVFITQSALTILFASVAMFIVDAPLAALSLIPVPFVIYIAARYGRQARPSLQEVQQRLAELTADTEESISGIRVVKAFAREDRQLSRFSHSASRVFDQSMEATRIRAFYTPLMGFLPSLGLAIVLLFGGYQVINDSLTLGDFTEFFLYLTMLVGPMRQLGMALGMAQRATASGERLFEILDRKPTMTVPTDAQPLAPGPGEVEFDHVTLQYENARSAALQDITLKIQPGRKVALVGGTGSGKTSLVALLPRLYDTSSGTVRIDGQDISTVTLSSLRSQIGIVDDDPFLFSASVGENISYAKPDAPIEKVREAAKLAQADGFIQKLPDGYDTVVGERGLTLSGGQRQRIALARAILAEPRVLILDDATSSVDASTEREIRIGLEAAMSGRTTFIIAHRLSTIALADEIVVLEDGRIADHGSHEQLLESSTLYRDIAEGLPDQVFLTRNPVDVGEGEVAGI